MHYSRAPVHFRVSCPRCFDCRYDHPADCAPLVYCSYSRLPVSSTRLASSNYSVNTHLSALQPLYFSISTPSDLFIGTSNCLHTSTSRQHCLVSSHDRVGFKNLIIPPRHHSRSSVLSQSQSSLPLIVGSSRLLVSRLNPAHLSG